MGTDGQPAGAGGTTEIHINDPDRCPTCPTNTIVTMQRVGAGEIKTWENTLIQLDELTICSSS